MPYQTYATTLDAIQHVADVFDIESKPLLDVFTVVYTATGLQNGSQAANEYAARVCVSLQPFVDFSRDSRERMSMRCWPLYSAIGSVFVSRYDDDPQFHAMRLARQYFQLLICRDWGAARAFVDGWMEQYRAEDFLPEPFPGVTLPSNVHQRAISAPGE